MLNGTCSKASMVAEPVEHLFCAGLLLISRSIWGMVQKAHLNSNHQSFFHIDAGLTVGAWLPVCPFRQQAQVVAALSTTIGQTPSG